jgi:molecular chaperone GrpE
VTEKDRPERPRVRVHDKRVSSKDAPDEPTPPASAAEAEALAEERLDQLMRLKADFENFRKRVIREQTELVERASLRIVERLLPVLDDLERALEAARQHEPSEAIVRGIELVFNQLHDALVEEGLERVRAEGAFDPQEHEAVSSVTGDVAEPTILEIVRPGYKLKGKTIRPALVHVSLPEQSQDGASAPPSDQEGGE